MENDNMQVKLIDVISKTFGVLETMGSTELDDHDGFINFMRSISIMLLASNDNSKREKTIKGLEILLGILKDQSNFINSTELSSMLNELAEEEQSNG